MLVEVIRMSVVVGMVVGRTVDEGTAVSVITSVGRRASGVGVQLMIRSTEVTVEVLLGTSTWAGIGTWVSRKTGLMEGISLSEIMVNPASTVGIAVVVDVGKSDTVRDTVND